MERRNGSLTQTMRLLERSFQGLRKAYNPVYRARKSGDIHSLVFAFPSFLPSFLLSSLLPSASLSLSLSLSFSLPSLSITLLAHRRNPAALPLIPFHFTIIFYELSDRASERSRPGLVRSFSETSKPISEALAAISPESLCTLSRSRFSSSVGEITARKVRKDS